MVDTDSQAKAPGASGPLAALPAEQLLVICAESGDAAAWDEFMRRFHNLVVSIARRTARHYTEPGMDLCNDLAPEVYLRLNADNRRMLREFVPRHEGSAYGYISVVTVHVVHDYFRGKRRIREDEVLPEIPAPEDANRQVLMTAGVTVFKVRTEYE